MRIFVCATRSCSGCVEQATPKTVQQRGPQYIYLLVRGLYIYQDIEMVAKGEALMRMKLRQQMQDTTQATEEAVRRREEAVKRCAIRAC